MHLIVGAPLSAGLSMVECMERACAVATLSVQKAGTQASYPGIGDLPADCH